MMLMAITADNRDIDMEVENESTYIWRNNAEIKSPGT